MAAIAAFGASAGAQLALGAVSAMGTLAAGAAQRRQYEEQARQLVSVVAQRRLPTSKRVLTLYAI